MLEILFIYFVGKKFYDLAELYNKNKWLFVVLSVLMYYGCIFLWLIVFSIIMEIIGYSVAEWSDLAFTLIGLVLSILTVFGFYKLMERKWSNDVTDASILDDDI